MSGVSRGGFKVHAYVLIRKTIDYGNMEFQVSDEGLKKEIDFWPNNLAYLLKEFTIFCD